MLRWWVKIYLRYILIFVLYIPQRLLTLHVASYVSSDVGYSVEIAALFCLFTLQNEARPELSPPTDVGYCPVKLGMMSNRLQSGVNTLQGFREDKRNQITLGK